MVEKITDERGASSGAWESLESAGARMTVGRRGLEARTFGLEVLRPRPTALSQGRQR
jgi:hypothetical protein